MRDLQGNIIRQTPESAAALEKVRYGMFPDYKTPAQVAAGDSLVSALTPAYSAAADAKNDITGGGSYPTADAKSDILGPPVAGVDPFAPTVDPSAGTYYSNNQGGIGLGVPGLGGVWRSADGTPIRDASGNSWGTGESVGQESSADRVDRIVREAQQANPSSGESQGPPSEGGYSNSMTRSGDNEGGSQAATGGLLHAYKKTKRMASGGKNTSLRSVVGTMRGVEHLMDYADGGSIYNLGSYSDGGRLLKGPGDGVSDSIPATIGKGQPARLADGEFVIPARIVSEIGNGSTDAGARKLYAMMDRIQSARGKTVGKGKVAKNTRADKYLPG